MPGDQGSTGDPGGLGDLVLADSTLTAGRVTVQGNPHLAVRVSCAACWPA